MKIILQNDGRQSFFNTEINLLLHPAEQVVHDKGHILFRYRITGNQLFKIADRAAAIAPVTSLYCLPQKMESVPRFSLSQIISPKHKELFKKRLEGLPLTKTEQEYYSRSVKKKVVELANAEPHGLARKLLEKYEAKSGTCYPAPNNLEA